jgi:hypothetical protein
MPSQSLSLPSQTSGEYVHWHTLPGWPTSGAQVHPSVQPAVEVHAVVHTLPVQPGPPSTGSPTGWQIPVGQSEFLVHGIPVPPGGGSPHFPAEQTRLVDPHVPFAQHASPKAPQVADPESEAFWDVEAESEPESSPLDAASMAPIPPSGR